MLEVTYQNYKELIKGSKTIPSKAEEKLRGDRTPSTVTSNFDDNAAMIGIAGFIKGSSLRAAPFRDTFLALFAPVSKAQLRF
jgi:hypothetical protein